MSFSASKDLSNQELRRLVEQLIGEVARLGERVAELEKENRALKDEVARKPGPVGICSRFTFLSGCDSYRVCLFPPAKICLTKSFDVLSNS